MSRPLRALWLVVGLWIAGRSTAVLYWPAPVSAPKSAETRLLSRIRPVDTSTFAHFVQLRVALVRPDHDIAASFVAARAIAGPARRALAVSTIIPDVDTEEPGDDQEPSDPVSTPAFAHFVAPTPRDISTNPKLVAPPLVSAPTPLARSRWSASTFLLARSGGSASLASAGQLGGSQVGARADYALSHGLFLTSRVSAPLSALSGREATFGLGIRHGPFGLIAEQRVALDGRGKTRPSATIYGGFSEAKLPGGFRLDGYGQAGLVSRDGFVDGAVRVEGSLVEQGRARLSLGGGLWGAAQPGVARVDVGPQIVARIPLAGRLFRASAEWRQRVAGHANPGSGPTFTLGADF